MAQNQPPTAPTGSDILISGDKDSLRKEEARFSDFAGGLKTQEIHAFLFTPAPDSTFRHETNQGRRKLRINGLLLEKIDYEVTFNPLASEAQKKTF